MPLIWKHSHPLSKSTRILSHSSCPRLAAKGGRCWRAGGNPNCVHVLQKHTIWHSARKRKPSITNSSSSQLSFHELTSSQRILAIASSFLHQRFRHPEVTRPSKHVHKEHNISCQVHAKVSLEHSSSCHPHAKMSGVGLHFNLHRRQSSKLFEQLILKLQK